MNKNRTQWMTHMGVLLGITLLLLFLPMGPGRFFGSDGDWYSQHTAIADAIRKTMLETKSLIPQYIALGGGSSIYDFSYYGLLRPDVLVSCLIPDVDMKYIVAGYAVLGVLASVQLCYVWLRKYGLAAKFSFWGSVLFAASACFYQAHHQIMFVNYMPFLLLALLGVERVLEKKKTGLLTVSLSLIYLHSFYYSIACLFVVGLYSLHRMLQKKVWVFGRLFLAVFLSIGMALVILFPTGLDILSTSKDGGSFAGTALQAVDLSLGGLLYSSYGCGMTMVALYTLLLSLQKKGRRLLSIFLLACMLFPAVSLAFNGFLYARAKILIPCTALLALVAAQTLQELWERRQKFSVWPLVVCLVPAVFSQWKPLILIDTGLLALWVVWQRTGRKKLRKGFWAIVSVPLLVSFVTNASASYLAPLCDKLGIQTAGKYLAASDHRQEIFSQEEIREVVQEKDYRFDNLANNFVNSNVLPGGNTGRTSMYSSVTNDVYSRFFYDTMENAISANNRVALTPGSNPCFLYFMGVRYILADKDRLPKGYETVREKGNYVLAENKNVLPVCYGTSSLILPETYEKLSFPENLAALTKGAVAGGAPKDTKELKQVFQKENPETFFRGSSWEEFLGENRDGKVHTLPLSSKLSGKVLVLRFHVEAPSGKAVEITVNGTKNKLSSVKAPYPNNNHDFTYVLESGDDMRELSVQAKKGNYEISQVEIYTADKESFGNSNVTVPQRIAGRAGITNSRSVSPGNVYRGSISMEKDGYFLTSYPFREGYEVLVDGRATEAEKVNTAFLGFPLTAGEHTITISYTAPGYRAGLLGSVCSWGLFGLVLAVEGLGSAAAEKRRRRRIREREVVVLEYL